MFVCIICMYNRYICLCVFTNIYIYIYVLYTAPGRCTYSPFALLISLKRRCDNNRQNKKQYLIHCMHLFAECFFLYIYIYTYIHMYTRISSFISTLCSFFGLLYIQSILYLFIFICFVMMNYIYLKQWFAAGKCFAVYLYD